MLNELDGEAPNQKISQPTVQWFGVIPHWLKEHPPTTAVKVVGKRPTNERSRHNRSIVAAHHRPTVSADSSKPHGAAAKRNETEATLTKAQIFGAVPERPFSRKARCGRVASGSAAIWPSSASLHREASRKEEEFSFDLLIFVGQVGGFKVLA